MRNPGVQGLRPGPPRRLALALALGVLLASACRRPVAEHYQGYVEGEYVYVSASVAGELTQLAVARGRAVEAGTPLFRLDPEPETLQLEETRRRREQAAAKLTDLQQGLRPSELAALEARLGRARSALDLARRDHERRRALHAAGGTDAVSDEELDRFRTDVELRSFEVEGLEADLATARLGARADAVLAAGKEVDALQASLAQIAWRIDEKAVAAPASGLVQDTLYREGEYVPAGRPVVALLPPGNLKIRFFVPQERLPSIQRGDLVAVQLDGLATRLRASISFISPEAEFTPPVIYSKESRTKLVFLIEATPDAASAERLRPGQPLEVYLD